MRPADLTRPPRLPTNSSLPDDLRKTSPVRNQPDEKLSAVETRSPRYRSATASPRKRSSPSPSPSIRSPEESISSASYPSTTEENPSVPGAPTSATPEVSVLPQTGVTSIDVRERKRERKSDEMCMPPASMIRRVPRPAPRLPATLARPSSCGGRPMRKVTPCLSIRSRASLG